MVGDQRGGIGGAHRLGACRSTADGAGTSDLLMNLAAASGGAIAGVVLLGLGFVGLALALVVVVVALTSRAPGEGRQTG
ncbi:hypothetical protein WSS_A40170 [Rhodococcus opacus M213]|uniref:Uncharacterized protein n=1 Tax=Rhodococcus opacus M213 TaxID=1129896 RepID=K8X808_RHOOP|nr:hypothetical protein WSS_A40170 [Rhodococcus opacus M213]